MAVLKISYRYKKNGILSTRKKSAFFPVGAGGLSFCLDVLEKALKENYGYDAVQIHSFVIEYNKAEIDKFEKGE